MDNRLKEINSRLSEYSIGNFDNNIKISPRLDEIDAISSGINMLGEELKSITISRDYFNNIFNSVSDMVFILTHIAAKMPSNVKICVNLKIFSVKYS